MIESKWNYGNVWVVFNGGVVECLIKSGCEDISTFGCDSADTYGLRKCIIKCSHAHTVRQFIKLNREEYMVNKACLVIFTLFILIPCISHAKMETIYAHNKYIMGDNDSKNDAGRMCFLEAKRKVLERVRTK